MPDLDDGGSRYVIGTGSPPFQSSCATADFAAVMAAASRVFRPFDADFSRLTLAAAELFRTTGAAEYNSYFVANRAASRPALLGGGAPSWPQVGSLALVAYYFSGQPSADEALRSQIRADTVAAADAIVARTVANAYPRLPGSQASSPRIAGHRSDARPPRRWRGAHPRGPTVWRKRFRTSA
jgi:hypothetical protein